MDSRHLVRCAAAVLLALLVGCSQQYNGAWRTAETAATRPAAKAGAAPPREVRPPAGFRQVEFDAPLPATHAVAPGPAPVAEVRPAANPLDRTLGPLGLYGHLPQAVPGSASPLDSLDNIRQVTSASEGADRDPDVDPTGTLLVYSSTRHRATADLYVQRVDGQAVTQLTDDPGNDVMPVFSPDGKRIAFASDRAGNWDIYLIDVDGGQPVQLTSDPTHDLHPSFSPDGKKLVYCSYGRQSGQWEMVVIDLENPASKRFIGFGLFPRWSPVDNRIVFQRARERGTRWFSLWTIELVNGEGVRPTEIAASSNAAAITPRWSPDGKHIVFCTVLNPDPGAGAESDLPAQADVWVMNADGTNRINLTQRRLVNTQPIWGKDGSIYFVSNRAKAGTQNIWALRPDRALSGTQPLRAAAPAPAPSQGPVPLPDALDKTKAAAHGPAPSPATSAPLPAPSDPGTQTPAPGTPGTPAPPPGDFVGQPDETKPKQTDGHSTNGAPPAKEKPGDETPKANSSARAPH